MLVVKWGLGSNTEKGIFLSVNIRNEEKDIKDQQRYIDKEMRRPDNRDQSHWRLRQLEEQNRLLRRRQREVERRRRELLEQQGNAPFFDAQTR